jgi:hypothetical protein
MREERERERESVCVCVFVCEREVRVLEGRGECGRCRREGKVLREKERGRIKGDVPYKRGFRRFELLSRVR